MSQDIADQEQTPKTSRPRGVTLVALCYLVIGTISLLITFSYLVLVIYSFMPVPCRVCSFFILVFCLFSIISFLFALIFIPIGIGLLKLKSWAQRLAIIVAIISPLLFTIPIVRALDVIFPFYLLLIPIAFNLICVVYLLTKGSRRAFRRPRTLAERRSAETLRRILEKSGNSCGDIGTEESR